jgi:hypothetical protein
MSIKPDFVCIECTPGFDFQTLQALMHGNQVHGVDIPYVDEDWRFEARVALDERCHMRNGLVLPVLRRLVFDQPAI